MATRTCAHDGVAYAVGAPACPHCGTTDSYETGSPEHLAATSAPTAPAGPVATEPGCSHPGCVLDHPHPGPAVLAEPAPGQQAATGRRGTKGAK